MRRAEGAEREGMESLISCEVKRNDLRVEKNSVVVMKPPGDGAIERRNVPSISAA